MNLANLSKQQQATVKKYTAISCGILGIVLWITLFAIGLLVNSSYYRAAISYGYWEWIDWYWAIISFTLSNVALLAFLAGFLGGICSKIIFTEGFMLDRKVLHAKKVDYVLFENPFISAFRGIFLFLGVLSLQYFSSFSDLASVSKNVPEKQTTEDKRSYQTLLDSVTDSSSRDKIKTFWKKEENSSQSNDDSLVNEIFLAKDTIEQLRRIHSGKNTEKEEKLDEKITALRRSIKVLPPLSDIPGLSSSSYFKFAIIVSLLAFICGYDPRMFATFLSNLPFLHNKDNAKKKET